ncbi:hypothetical protein AKO1_003040 [Acrasis kona]|uniref:RGS domain-containing protein n=1 Tax=Acrasis kona TaxID=1008807 RepID=A0AAW2ZBE1_9EUKA
MLLNELNNADDEFKFMVLLNYEQHDILTRLCFKEYSEGFILLFDSIQCYREEECDEVKDVVFTDAYKNYIDKSSRNTVSRFMDPNLYGRFEELSRVEGGWLRIDRLISELEDFLVKKLKATYDKYCNEKFDYKLTLLYNSPGSSPRVDGEVTLTETIYRAPPCSGNKSAMNLNSAVITNRKRRRTRKNSWNRVSSWFNKLRMF